ncbi:hypothetical protein ACFVFI_09000 [Streptomyces sp. NPDC057705]|uniref:effector-associated constant component EACC1 n=1 Tax=Streptomyces sp. NPDC057705 TaxID=3346222 RepID=UPI0036743A36
MREKRGAAGMRVRIDSGDGGGVGGGPAEGGRGPEETAGLTGDFADWLAQDREVSRHAVVRRVRADPPEGAMSGDLVEWISLAVSSGFSTSALVYAHRTFRASLPPRLRSGARLVVEHEGVRVVIEDGTEEDVARVVRALAGAGAAGSPGDGSPGDGPRSAPGRSQGAAPEDAHGAGS